jgi:aldose 1-epimerase
MRPTGQHHVLTGLIADQLVEVTIAQVAAALRGFSVDGVDVVQRYAENAIPPLGAGIVMVPWPNRVDHGRWPNHGVIEQLDISQVAQDHALHGLLKNTAYTVVARSAASITLSASIYAPPGYPFVVATSVRYTITDEGLEVEHRLRNHSATAAPVAVGTHGYYKIGGVRTEDLVITSSARTVYVDDERQVPVSRTSASGDFDLRAGRRVGDLVVDHCFTNFSLTDGRHTTTLSASDGRRVEVWSDQNFAYQVLLTTRQFTAESGRPTFAVAIEPQTAAVDAFNNREGLHELQPDEEWVVRWGVTPVLRPAFAATA